MVEKGNSGLAGFLSLIVPGLGQVYNGQKIKGILFFIFPFILWNVAYMFSPHIYVMGRGLFAEYMMATLICFIIRIYSAIDAKNNANYGDTEDFSFSKFKSENGLVNKKTILVALFFIFLVWGMVQTSNTDFTNNTILIDSLATNDTVDGQGIANSSITIDCSKPQISDFYMGYAMYYELEVSGNGVITVNLSEINWTGISRPSLSMSSLSLEEGGNVNLSVADYFNTAVNDTITNPENLKIDLDIVGLDELTYGGKMQGSEPTDEEAYRLQTQGVTSVSAYQTPLDTDGYIESYSITDDILTINVNIQQGYGYISSPMVSIENKTAFLDLTLIYNNITYEIDFNEINVDYNV